MIRFILIIFLFCCLAMNCEPDPNQIISQHRTLIDTLVERQTKVLRVQLDSICEADFDRLVAEAADSIIAIRLQNIEKIKGQ